MSFSKFFARYAAPGFPASRRRDARNKPGNRLPIGATVALILIFSKTNTHGLKKCTPEAMRPFAVMAGLVPAIHVVQLKKWKRFATMLPWRSTKS
jgi:hypothetical protein